MSFQLYQEKSRFRPEKVAETPADGLIG